MYKAKKNWVYDIIYFLILMLKISSFPVRWVYSISRARQSKTEPSRKPVVRASPSNNDQRTVRVNADRRTNKFQLLQQRNACDEPRVMTGLNLNLNKTITSIHKNKKLTSDSRQLPTSDPFRASYSFNTWCFLL
jgi:hypothetical protein